MTQVAESFQPRVEIAEVVREDATENSGPIVVLANKIIEKAFKRGASDVHLEPASDYLRVRYRIDGELSEVMMVPKYAQDALITRLKIMCDMRIDERRQPQDGKIDFTKYHPATAIDLRVSTVPTPYGEDMVMRILDKKSSVLSLDMLGFNEHQQREVNCCRLTPTARGTKGRMKTRTKAERVNGTQRKGFSALSLCTFVSLPLSFFVPMCLCNFVPSS